MVPVLVATFLWRGALAGTVYTDDICVRARTEEASSRGLELAMTFLSSRCFPHRQAGQGYHWCLQMKIGSAQIVFLFVISFLFRGVIDEYKLYSNVYITRG